MNHNRVPPREVLLTALIRSTVGGALCSPAHAAVWKTRRKRAGLPTHVSDTPYRLEQACAHCIVCGILVATPEDCAVHGNSCVNHLDGCPPGSACYLSPVDCPRYDREFTDTAVMVVAALHAGGLPWPMTDAGMTALLETSRMLEDGGLWSGHELFQRCREALL